MIKRALIGVTLCFFITSVFGQECKVLIENIEGVYTGKCKKGFANGVGKSIGLDTYEGGFKKGLPHGKGTYQFADGNVYVGEFKKGKKFGKGKMTFLNDVMPSLIGYWIDDEFAGKSKKVYKVIDRSSSVKKLMFRRLDGTENRLQFKFAFNGKPIKSEDVVFDAPMSTLVQKNDFLAEYLVERFPISGNIQFRAGVTKTANGSTEFISGQAEIEIGFKGDWEIIVEMNNTE